MTPSKKFTYFSISAFAHLTLALMFALQFKHANILVKYGNSEENVISSYLYQVSENDSQKTLPVTEAQQSKQDIGLALQKQKLAEASKTAKRKLKIKGAPMPQLIAILHKAIQENQHYPSSAQQMEREGRVTVFFTLLHDGKATNIKVAKSSGTKSLDRAALSAVEHAAPFKNAENFIEDQQDFQIDVVFKIS